MVAMCFQPRKPDLLHQVVPYPSEPIPLLLPLIRLVQASRCIPLREAYHLCREFIVKACTIQNLEGLVPLSKGLELEFVLVLVLCQGLESLLAVEEALEDPQLAQLKEGDAPGSMNNVEGECWRDRKRNCPLLF
jgi:hypothetical protein